MTIFFNNCWNKDHIDIYNSGNSTVGEVPFYDFYLDEKFYGYKYMSQLQPGDECIVACYDNDEDELEAHVLFEHYEFVRREIQKPYDDDNEKDSVVFFGCLKRTEPHIRKPDAAKHPLYAKFFDRNGNFKRLSVMQG